MKRLFVLVCALVVCGGCASDGSKHWWDDAMDDANGKNMQMRNDFSTPSIGSLKKPSDS